MTAVILILMMAALIYARPQLHNRILAGEPWLSRERTSFVNGFFIILVFLSHIQQYQYPQFPGERAILRAVIPDQLIVTTFFLYSGYGIMYSILRKGKSYVNSIITRRFPQLLLNFSIAVLIFVALQYLMGKTYSIPHILLSFIGWQSVGNSNWFICMTLLAYVIVFASFSIGGTRRPRLSIALTAIMLIIGMTLICQVKAAYWCDTCLCIPAGLLFALYKERIERLLMYTPIPTILLGLFLVVAGYVAYFHCGRSVFPYKCISLLVANVGSVLFAGGLTIVYGCVSLRRLPRFMVWVGGAALFPMYIFQRVPMLIGSYLGVSNSHPQLYIAGCFVVCLLLAAIFQRIFAWLARLIFPVQTPAAMSPSPQSGGASQ